MVKLDISLGEALDKLSILQVKYTKIATRELGAQYIKLSKDVLDQIDLKDYKDIYEKEYLKLVSINETLFDLEDQIREALQTPDTEADNYFYLAHLVRSIHGFNRKRAEVKKAIDLRAGDTTEVKKYHGQ